MVWGGGSIAGVIGTGPLSAVVNLRIDSRVTSRSKVKNLKIRWLNEKIVYSRQQNIRSMKRN